MFLPFVVFSSICLCCVSYVLTRMLKGSAYSPLHFKFNFEGKVRTAPSKPFAVSLPFSVMCVLAIFIKL